MDQDRLDAASLVAARKAAKSSSAYSCGFHSRGLWLKIWIDVAAALDAALDRLVEAAGRGHVGADQHGCS